jgi:hypothetical protein
MAVWHRLADVRARNWMRLTLLVVAAATCTPAIAAWQSSPEPFKIRALQISDASGVLRIAVQRLTVPGIAADPLTFNPAACTQTTATYSIVGTNNSLLIFDLALGARGRSRTKQRQMLNAFYEAFASDRLVTISVRDDLCTATNTPYVSGVEVK